MKRCPVEMRKVNFCFPDVLTYARRLIVNVGFKYIFPMRTYDLYFYPGDDVINQFSIFIVTILLIII